MYLKETTFTGQRFLFKGEQFDDVLNCMWVLNIFNFTLQLLLLNIFIHMKDNVIYLLI